MFAAIAAAFTIIFLALHIAGRIDWSWWVVFSPMIVLGVLTLAGFVQGIVHYRAHAKAIQAQVDMLLTVRGAYGGVRAARPGRGSTRCLVSPRRCSGAVQPVSHCQMSTRLSRGGVPGSAGHN